MLEEHHLLRLHIIYKNYSNKNLYLTTQLSCPYTCTIYFLLMQHHNRVTRCLYTCINHKRCFWMATIPSKTCKTSIQQIHCLTHNLNTNKQWWHKLGGPKTCGVKETQIRFIIYRYFILMGSLFVAKSSNPPESLNHCNSPLPA